MSKVLSGGRPMYEVMRALELRYNRRIHTPHHNARPPLLERKHVLRWERAKSRRMTKVPASVSIHIMQHPEPDGA